MFSFPSSLNRSAGGLGRISRQVQQFRPRSRISSRFESASSSRQQFTFRSSFSTATRRPQSLSSSAPHNTSGTANASTGSGSVSTPKPASSPTATAAAGAAEAGTASPPPMWQRLGPLTTFFRFYGRSQATRPYTTQFFSGLVIFSLGDLVAQYIGGEEYDANRTLRVLAISAGSSIPAYKWLLFVGKNFNYSSKLRSVATKVLVNQLVYAPVFGSYYFTMQSLLAGDSLAQAWERVKASLPVMVRNSWLFWPPITALTFNFISPSYQAVTMAAVATLWQTYLSYLNRKADGSVESAVVRGELAAAV